MIILAIPATVRRALRGDPTIIELEKLIYTKDQYNDFMNFLDKYLSISNNDMIPKWYLSSYWG